MLYRRINVYTSPVNGPLSCFQWGEGVRKGLLPRTHVPGAVVGRTLLPLGWMLAEDVLGSGTSLSFLNCACLDLHPCQQCVPWPFPFFFPLSAPRLRCCAGYSLVVAHRLLIAVASLVAEHGLESPASVAVVPVLSCSEVCGIFLDHGSNPRPLHWQADSLPLSHKGSPELVF